MTELLMLLEKISPNSQLRQILLGLIVFFGAQIVSLGIVKLTKQVLLKINHQKITDLVLRISGHLNIFFYQTLGIFAVSRVFDIPDLVYQWVGRCVILSLSYFVILMLQEILEYLIVAVLRRNYVDSSRSFDPAAGHFLYSVSRVVLWIMVFASVLPYLYPGGNLAGIITAFGVTGIAVGFAMQSVLSDIIASFSIYLDKPFEVGDFIETKEDGGTVIRIGLRSTRLRSLLGEEIVIPNRELTTVRIHNFKLLERRRVRFEFGLEYFNSASVHEKIIETITEIISVKKLATLDRAVIKELTETKIKYEVVFYVESDKYDDYARVQHEIYIDILKSFEGLGLYFTVAVEPVKITSRK